MPRTILLATAISLALVVPAAAFHCPVDMGKIDAALPQAKLSTADKAKVMSLRTEGEALHKAGNHARAVKVLGQAMKILGVK